MYLSSGKVSSEPEMGQVPTFEVLVYLTWNDPVNNSLYKHDFICISETYFDS